MGSVEPRYIEPVNLARHSQRDQVGRCTLDTRALGIPQPRLLEREPRIREQLQIHEQIAVSQPRARKRRGFPHHTSQ